MSEARLLTFRALVELQLGGGIDRIGSSLRVMSEANSLTV
jgi:hypothetical protein